MKHKIPLLIVISILSGIVIIPLFVGLFRSAFTPRIPAGQISYLNEPPAEYMAWKDETRRIASSIGKQVGALSDSSTSLTFLYGGVKDENAKLPAYMASIEYNDVFQIIEVTLKLEENTWEEFFGLQKEGAKYLRSMNIEPCDAHVIWSPEDEEGFYKEAGVMPSSIVYFCEEEGHPLFPPERRNQVNL